MRLKKFTVVLVLACFISVYASKPVHAVVDPLTPYLVASLIIHAAVFGVCVYKKLTGGGGSSASGTANGGKGAVSTEAQVVWVDLTGPNGTPKVTNKNIVATTDMQSLKATVDANGSQAPKLKAALADKPAESEQTGNVIQTSIGRFLLGSLGANSSGYDLYVTQDPSPIYPEYQVARSAPTNVESVLTLDGYSRFQTYFNLSGYNPDGSSYGLLSRYSWSTQPPSTFTANGYTYTKYRVHVQHWNATSTTQEPTYNPNPSPFVPSEAATAINGDTIAQSEIPGMLAKVPNCPT